MPLRGGPGLLGCLADGRLGDQPPADDRGPNRRTAGRSPAPARGHRRRRAAALAAIGRRGRGPGGPGSIVATIAAPPTPGPQRRTGDRGPGRGLSRPDPRDPDGSAVAVGPVRSPRSPGRGAGGGGPDRPGDAGRPFRQRGPARACAGAIIGWPRGRPAGRWRSIGRRPSSVARWRRARGRTRWPDGSREISATALANSRRGREAGRTYLEAAAAVPPSEGIELRRRAFQQLLCSGEHDLGLEELRKVFREVGLPIAETATKAMLSACWTDPAPVPRDALPPAPLYAIDGDELMRMDIGWSAGMSLCLIDTAFAAQILVDNLHRSLRAGEALRAARSTIAVFNLLAVRGRKGLRWAGELLALAEPWVGRLDDPELLAIYHMARGVAAYTQGRWPERRTERSEHGRVPRSLHRRGDFPRSVRVLCPPLPGMARRFRRAQPATGPAQGRRGTTRPVLHDQLPDRGDEPRPARRRRPGRRRRRDRGRHEALVAPGLPCPAPLRPGRRRAYRAVPRARRRGPRLDRRRPPRLRGVAAPSLLYRQN